MQFLPYLFVAAVILAGCRLKQHQDRADAASPLIPCDRCGTPTPVGALFAHARDGHTIEVCARCEWPNGV